MTPAVHPVLARLRALGLGLVLVGVVGCGGPTEEELAQQGEVLDSASEGLAEDVAAPVAVLPVVGRVSLTAPAGVGAISSSLGLNAPTQDPSGAGVASDSPDPIPARGGDGNPDGPLMNAQAVTRKN